MTTITAEPTVRRAARNGRARPRIPHFSRFSSIARRFGEGFEPTVHPNQAEGILTCGEESFRVVLSFDEETLRLRIFARVAYTAGKNGEIDALPSILNASARYARLEHDVELHPQLTLEATLPCRDNASDIDEEFRQLLHEVRRLLWDPRLHGALARSGAKSCIYRAEP